MSVNAFAPVLHLPNVLTNLARAQVPQKISAHPSLRSKSAGITSFGSLSASRSLTSFPGPAAGLPQSTASQSAMASKRKPTQVPRPSSSVVLISPQNEILLLHRVRTSTSFPSAHVFPGGNISEFHDGRAPEPSDPGRHVDGPAYRLAAIRETFEESGILLAHNNGFGRLLEVSESERDEGRRLVHKGEVPFPQWLAKKGGRADVDNLIPFTRWITPPNVPKRFTTQMYIYFLPAASTSLSPSSSASLPSPQGETLIPIPTHDGGIEHTAAKFLPATDWLRLARSGEIILFPPQFFLLTLVARFLKPCPGLGRDALEAQRRDLRAFARGGDPPWGTACISPTALIGQLNDGRTALTLEKAGEGLERSGRRGVKDYVVLVRFAKDGPRDVEVRTRAEVLRKLRMEVGEMGTAYSHALQHLQTKATREEKL